MTADFTSLALSMAERHAERRDRLQAIRTQADRAGQIALEKRRATRAQLADHAQVRALASRGIDGFFPTPTALAAQVVERANIRHGARVLEPSAGAGAIAQAVRARYADTVTLHVAEINYSLRDRLQSQGYTVAGDNCLTLTGTYDAIVMNPPFEHGKDAQHVRAMYNLLAEGGRLVAITGAGIFSRTDRHSTEFRAWLESIGGIAEPLPACSFAHALRSTGVQTYLVTLDK